MSDGYTARRLLHKMIREDPNTTAGLADRVLADYETTWDFLDAGACAFARRTLCLRRTLEITTIADTYEYNLPPDYISILLNEKFQRPLIMYTDGDDNKFFAHREPYSEFVDHDFTLTRDHPGCFDILDSAISTTLLTGTATANGALDSASGKSTLTAAAGAFATTYLTYPRYRIHNTKSGHAYRGIVLSVTSGTALVTAMFDADHASQGWASADTYSIAPTGNYKLRLDYANSTAAETITIEYHCLPPPVYSVHDTWGFPDPNNTMAAVAYAAWLYKYSEPGGANEKTVKGDKFYVLFDMLCKAANEMKREREYIPYQNEDFLDVL